MSGDDALLRDLLLQTGPVGTLIGLLGVLVRNWLAGLKRSIDQVTRLTRLASMRAELHRAELAHLRNDLRAVLDKTGTPATPEPEELRRLRMRLEAMESAEP